MRLPVPRVPGCQDRGGRGDEQEARTLLVLVASRQPPRPGPDLIAMEALPDVHP
jgi:hypothetical protein